jgi:hypothetical protein
MLIILTAQVRIDAFFAPQITAELKRLRLRIPVVPLSSA